MIINIDECRYYIYISLCYLGGPMILTNYLSLFKALADQTRLNIVNMLSHREMCACELLEKLSISQPTLSHHMKILIASDLVINRKNATWVYYSINKSTLQKVRELFAELQERADQSDDHENNVCHTSSQGQSIVFRR